MLLLVFGQEIGRELPRMLFVFRDEQFGSYSTTVGAGCQMMIAVPVIPVCFRSEFGNGDGVGNYVLTDGVGHGHYVPAGVDYHGRTRRGILGIIGFHGITTIGGDTPDKVMGAVTLCRMYASSVPLSPTMSAIGAAQNLSALESIDPGYL